MEYIYIVYVLSLVFLQLQDFAAHQYNGVEMMDFASCAKALNNGSPPLSTDNFVSIVLYTTQYILHDLEQAKFVS